MNQIKQDKSNEKKKDEIFRKKMNSFKNVEVPGVPLKFEGGPGCLF